MSRTRAPRATHLTLVAPGDPAMAAAVQAPRKRGEISDIARLKDVYPRRWKAFLRAHFRDHLEVEYFFGVDESTARKWWEGVSAPRAHVLAVALAEIPSAAAWLLPRAA